MKNLLRKLFPTEEPATIKALRAVVSENKSDAAWRESFLAKQEALKAELEAARVQLETTPSDDAASRYIELHQAHELQAKALQAAHHIIHPVVRKLALKRTLEPLRDALKSLLESLQAKRREVIKRESDLAQEIGIAEASGSSPAVDALNRRINSAEAHQAKLADLAWDDFAGTLDSSIEFILEDK